MTDSKRHLAHRPWGASSPRRHLHREQTTVECDLGVCFWLTLCALDSAGFTEVLGEIHLARPAVSDRFGFWLKASARDRTGSPNLWPVYQ
jgi:hypothetical protein